MPQSGSTSSLGGLGSLGASFNQALSTDYSGQWNGPRYHNTAAACQHYYTMNFKWDYTTSGATSTWINYALDTTGISGTITVTSNFAPETPEQKVAREAADAFRAHIGKKAEKLLVALLTATQKKMWLAMGLLLIPSAVTPGRVYRLSRKTGLIRMYQDGVPMVDLCIHENEGLPLADRIIAMKFLIDAEEPELHRIALKHAVPAAERDPLRPELLKLAKAA